MSSSEAARPAAAGETEAGGGGGGRRCPRGRPPSQPRTAPAASGPSVPSGGVSPAGAAGGARGSAPDGERSGGGGGGGAAGAAGSHWVPAGRPGAEHAGGQRAGVPGRPALPPPARQGHQLVRAVTGRLRPLCGPPGDALEGGH